MIRSDPGSMPKPDTQTVEPAGQRGLTAEDAAEGTQ